MAESISIDEAEIYWQAITIIEAQDKLSRLTDSDWPRMKTGAREKLHKRLYRQAYPSIFRETQQVSNEDLARILKG